MGFRTTKMLPNQINQKLVILVIGNLKIIIWWRILDRLYTVGWKRIGILDKH